MKEATVQSTNDPRTLTSGQRQLAAQTYPLAVKLAKRYCVNGPTSTFDYEDFVSAAGLGLCIASTRYSEKRADTFRPYAAMRIRGAMLDMLRKDSGIIRRQYRALVDNEMPFRFAKNSRELVGMVNSIEGLPMTVLEQVDGSLELAYSEELSPEARVWRRVGKEALHRVIRQLPDDERTIIERRYFHDETLDEIGESLGGYSKSWLSRIHRRALERLREMLESDEALQEQVLQAA
ncbi:MAG: sigma-70 family RNA polymerase sigma factor [Bdellovibrionales bacterium]|nr:sigma-70 family RNA polymerase sigma factor [Bdellovibrionales bacterium]